MKTLIVEDEAPAFRRLQKVIDDIAPDIEILDVVDSVSDAVKWLNAHHPPQLIFMDIQLSDGLSFEIFEQVKVSSPVIFTTAFDEYLLEAFKVNSIDYLLKPINADDLSRSLNKLKELKGVLGEQDTPDLNDLIASIRLSDRQYKNRFLVKQGGKLLSIQTSEVAYFTTRNGVVYLVTFEDTKFIMDLTLDELGQKLDPDLFFRANRQFLIHYEFVKSVERYHKGKLIVNTALETSEQVSVSEEKAGIFKRWLDK